MKRPQPTSSFTLATAAARAAVVAGLALVGAACGSSSDPVDPPRGHGHIEIGSTQTDSGSLDMEVPFESTIEVFESAEVGELTLWAGTNPGLATLEEDDPEHGLYALPDGVPLSLEITALDAGVRFKFGETTIDEPGQSVLIGPSPFHTSGEWQVVLPQGVHDGEYDLTFRVTATPPFAPSEPTTVTLIRPRVGTGTTATATTTSSASEG